MSKTKSFNEANVFMSRNLVPPEIFDALLDALNQNAANVFLCCDPSRNGPNDFHLISSPDHEKFEDLKSKGCNLLGPQCVLSCAKENRPLPKQAFTCCLAFHGIKVLASGFDADEKVKIEKMVTAMGGVLLTKTSLDISFVIVKNVLAAKYKINCFIHMGLSSTRALELLPGNATRKWALNVLKKPIVSINWLHQCWIEHRVVPKDSYRILPFSGLTICVTRVPADERKQIVKRITQNGGKYSAELTKMCTHLISDVPEGDKYNVARRWGHIHVVTRKWFDQSIDRRACLNEESYPIQGNDVSSNKIARGSSMSQHSQDKCIGASGSQLSSMAAESNLPDYPVTGFSDPELEATLSRNMYSMFSDPTFTKQGHCEIPTVKATVETNLDGCVANDSQSDDNDLYLSECRISLVGFRASELRKLVNMVRRGGGSQYMSVSDKLTHIVVGAPSEVEKKEHRDLAASGVINVVRTTWLEDCDRERKEVPVLRQHIAYDLLLPKDSMSSFKGAVVGMVGTNQVKISGVHSATHSDQIVGNINSGNEMPSSEDKNRDERPEFDKKEAISVEAMRRQSLQKQIPIVNNQVQGRKKTHQCSSEECTENRKPTSVFRGKTFCFSESFPQDRRAEVVQWIGQGGGEIVSDIVKQNVNFTIEYHGVISGSLNGSQTTYVSSHWVRSCLEDGCLLDVGSHILYSPLPCQIPLPGFENLRFCVSQYEEKDRSLLRNLCVVVGAKFVEKLTKKVTHLLCKFTSGPKYEAACKWGIRVVTSGWIFECVRKNEVVLLDPFLPKEVTSQDQELGLCPASQFPTQAVRMLSGDCPSQLLSQSQDLRKAAQIGGSRLNSDRNEASQSNDHLKKARLWENDGQKDLVSSITDSSCIMDTTGANNSKDDGESFNGVPDVAAAIEDFLEQTSKIHDQKTPGRTVCDKNLFPSDCAMLGEVHGVSPSVIGQRTHWSNREDSSNPSADANVGPYDRFSETQTESQVVGYEEDLSGRQMLIDRVRTRSSMA